MGWYIGAVVSNGGAVGLGNKKIGEKEKEGKGNAAGGMEGRWASEVPNGVRAVG